MLSELPPLFRRIEFLLTYIPPLKKIINTPLLSLLNGDIDFYKCLWYCNASFNMVW